MTDARLTFTIQALQNGKAPFDPGLAVATYELLGLRTHKVGRLKFNRAGDVGPWRLNPSILTDINAALRLVAEIWPEAQVEMRLIKGGCFAVVKLVDGRGGLAMRADHELAAAIVTALLKGKRPPVNWGDTPELAPELAHAGVLH